MHVTIPINEGPVGAELPDFLWLGPNDGGIKRGDREDTGDNEARPSETGGPDDAGGTSELDELAIVDADDPNLGLTTGDEENDDWAANTGPTNTDEGGAGGMTNNPKDRGSTLNPKRYK